MTLAQAMPQNSQMIQQTMIVNDEESKESNITINDEVRLRQKNLEVRSLEQ